VATKEYTYTVLYEPAEEGGYVVTCPALPGLVTEGDTLDEARDMARDAIRAYLESLKKTGCLSHLTQRLSRNRSKKN
jgi:antitoxin HicB